MALSAVDKNWLFLNCIWLGVPLLYLGSVLLPTVLSPDIPFDSPYFCLYVFYFFVSLICTIVTIMRWWWWYATLDEQGNKETQGLPQSHAVLFPKFEKTELGNEDGLRSGDLDIRLLHQSS